MSAQNQLEKLGNQFFKYRGQIPVLFFLVAFILMHFFPMYDNWLNPNYTYLAIGLVVLGHAIRALAVGKRAAHTSGRNRDEQVAEALNSTGIYSMVRHPLYLGNITTYIGTRVFDLICSLLSPDYLCRRAVLDPQVWPRLPRLEKTNPTLVACLLEIQSQPTAIFHESCARKRIFWLGSFHDHGFCVAFVPNLRAERTSTAKQHQLLHRNGFVYCCVWLRHALPQKENARF
jgi:protein-S-isoprenylcysteine O-methyltransferase Ste14